MKAACLLSLSILFISPPQLVAQSTPGRDGSVIREMSGRLLAYYPFNGNSNDESGNGNNGIVINATPTTDRFGSPGKAFYFDGSTSYIRLGNIFNSVFCAPVAKWTITGWASTESSSWYPGGGAIIIKAAGGTYGPYQWSLNHDHDGRLKVSVESKFDASQLLVKQSDYVPTGRWFFYALIFDGSQAEEDRVQLYVDGAAGTLLRHLGPFGTTTEATNQEITIGAGHATGNPSYPNNQYSGSIDDIRIYDDVLSAAEIDSLFHEGGWPVPLPPPTLTSVSPALVSKGSDLIVEIRIGDSTGRANLFGVGFDLLYTNTPDIDYVSADASGSFLGDDFVYLITPDNPNGKLSVGLSRKAPLSGVSGGGTLIRLKFHIASTAPENGTVTFSFANVSANDQNGTFIALSPLSSTTTIQGLSVWPGDTDNNGLANQGDILPLGLYWGKTGPARSNASMQWTAQSATAWVPQAATYADANGDGAVNQADVLPIGLNWGKTHSLDKVASSIATGQLPMETSVLRTPVLRASGPLPVRDETTFDVNITLGDTIDSVSSLFGISFVLDFARSKSIIQVMEVTPGSFLGNDMIFFPQIDNDNGFLALGMSRKSGAVAVSGFGQVAKIKFKVVNNTSTSSVSFTTRDISANDADGNKVMVMPSSSSVFIRRMR